MKENNRIVLKTLQIIALVVALFFVGVYIYKSIICSLCDNSIAGFINTAYYFLCAITICVCCNLCYIASKVIKWRNKNMENKYKLFQNIKYGNHNAAIIKVNANGTYDLLIEGTWNQVYCVREEDIEK